MKNKVNLINKLMVTCSTSPYWCLCQQCIESKLQIWNLFTGAWLKYKCWPHCLITDFWKGRCCVL